MIDPRWWLLEAGRRHWYGISHEHITAWCLELIRPIKAHDDRQVNPPAKRVKTDGFALYQDANEDNDDDDRKLDDDNMAAVIIPETDDEQLEASNETEYGLPIATVHIQYPESNDEWPLSEYESHPNWDDKPTYSYNGLAGAEIPETDEEEVPSDDSDSSPPWTWSVSHRGDSASMEAKSEIEDDSDGAIDHIDIDELETGGFTTTENVDMFTENDDFMEEDWDDEIDDDVPSPVSEPIDLNDHTTGEVIPLYSPYTCLLTL